MPTLEKHRTNAWVEVNGGVVPGDDVDGGDAVILAVVWAKHDAPVEEA